MFILCWTNDERQKREALSQWKSATARELVAGRKSGFPDVLLLLSLPSQSKTQVAFGSSSSSPSFIFGCFHLFVGLPNSLTDLANIYWASVICHTCRGSCPHEADTLVDNTWVNKNKVISDTFKWSKERNLGSHGDGKRVGHLIG